MTTGRRRVPWEADSSGWCREPWQAGSLYSEVVYRNTGDPVILLRLGMSRSWVVASNYAHSMKQLPGKYSLTRAKQILDTMRLLNTVPNGWTEGQWESNKEAG